jgi:nicotinamidase-related amidase
LVQAFGWSDVMDLGDIATARATEGYLPLWSSLWKQLGTLAFNIKVVRVPDATRMVPRLMSFIARCRQLGLPVVFTAFAGTHHGLDRPRSGAYMPNRYSVDEGDSVWFREGRIWHELTVDPADVVIFKPSYGAFYDTSLGTVLQNLGRDTIIITGTLTNFSCGTTARQGYERGFQVVVASDLTATDDPDFQNAECVCCARASRAC